MAPICRPSCSCNPDVTTGGATVIVENDVIVPQADDLPSPRSLGSDPDLGADEGEAMDPASVEPESPVIRKPGPPEVSPDIGAGAIPRRPRNIAPTGEMFSDVAKKHSATEAYRKAMQLMWNYDLERARKLLEPWRNNIPWHAGAYAECALLRVVITGRHSEAHAALDLVAAAEGLLARSRRSLAREVFTAEMLFLRSGLQIILGSRIRGVLNLRQCWYSYRRLENSLQTGAFAETYGGSGAAAATKHASGLRLKKGGAAQQQQQRLLDDEADVCTIDDLRGRVIFGLGFFYLTVSLLPSGLSQLVRLAGFVTHKEKGKAYLWECIEKDVSTRAAVAAVFLSMYHLDLEPDIARAGDLLVVGLARRPENAMLHWSGSLLARRNTCIAQAMEMTRNALWCCGDELGNQAIYLRFDLGMLHFVSMDWPAAHRHLRYVSDTLREDKIFFPYRMLVTTQLAAVAFSMGHAEEGESLCHECAALQDWTAGILRLECDFAKVMQVFLKHRVNGRQLLAFEVMYLLRQFPKVPAPMLLDIQRRIRHVSEPHRAQLAKLKAIQSATGKGSPLEPFKLPKVRQDSPEMKSIVEYVSARVIECILLFYLGDPHQAMSFVPELSHLCTGLPAWCSYLGAHGLYWCGRIFALRLERDEALRCFRRAKAHKKYPFDISVKISKVLESLETPGAAAAVVN